MTKTDELIHWLRAHAIGRSVTVPNGWIRGEDLYDLARQIMEKEPFDYSPKPEPAEGK